jgi:hypothetical protein
MAADPNHHSRFVTNQELKEELERLPSRWEVRFLILAGMIASQVIPATDIARAAVKVVLP